MPRKPSNTFLLGMTRIPVMFFVLALYCSTFAAERHLTPAQLDNIQQICRSLIGTPVDSREHFARALDQFRPYARNPAEIDDFSTICSADCRGTIRLIDSTEVQISTSNIPLG